jgi:hypothetical protein
MKKKINFLEKIKFKEKLKISLDSKKEISLNIFFFNKLFKKLNKKKFI